MRKLWPLLLTSAIGIAILCGLGTWQVFRLAEKTKLIAQLEARMNGEPMSLVELLSRQAKGENIEYYRVNVAGCFEPSKTVAKLTTVEGQPAWEFIYLVAYNGLGVTKSFVDRQFKSFIVVDAGVSMSKQFLHFQTTCEQFTGTVRLHNKGRGYFDNDNDAVENVWYWWNLSEMRRAAGANPIDHVSSFVVQKLPTGQPSYPPFPKPLEPRVELSNNHLGYAITWFGLAAALLTVTGFFARSLVLDRKEQDS
jgi:surfeit locus 1 family protein